VTATASSRLAAVLADVDAHAETAIERLCELIRHPSRTGQLDEVRACATWLSGELRAAGFTAEIVDVDAGGPVIFAEVPAPAGAPTLLFYSHYDVISPEPVAAWSYPPFGAVREEGRIYGRGSTDAKANVMSIVEGVAAWRRVAGGPPIGIKLMLDGEEEAGSSNLPGFLEVMGDRLKADGAVSFDGGVDASGRSKIGLGTSGMLFVELRVRGAKRELHSAGARIFPNPAWRLVWALASIKGPDEIVRIDGFNDPIQPPGDTDRRMMAAMGWGGRQQLREAGVEDFVLGLSDEAALERLLFQPGLALAGINGGYTDPGMKAVIPTEAVAKLEFRIVPDQDPHTVLAQLRAHLDGHGFEDVAIEVLATVETAKTDPDSPLVQVVAEAARAQFGGAMIKPTEEYAGRQGAWLGEMLGIPGVQTGVGPPGFRGHAADEFVTEEHFIKGIRLAASILAGFADHARS
jgi:acetylornithine deacetylase/succinyl-diaminopimelate desuccinylase-like protein